MTKKIKLNLQFFKKLPASEKRITIPTVLSIMRILLVPIIVAAMVMQQWGLAFNLFLAASITDFLDGNLARWLNQQTFLGACLDPIADKLFTLSIFFTLFFVKTPLFSLPLWFVSVVLIKELTVMVGVFIMFALKGYIQVRPTKLGKIVTLMEVGFILWLFSCYFFKWMPVKTYYTMLGLLLFLSFLALLQYIRIGIGQLRQ